MLHIAIIDDEGKIRRKFTADCFIGVYHIVDNKDGVSMSYVNCETDTLMSCLDANLKAIERISSKLKPLI